MKTTIVTVCLNSVSTIRDTIESALSQDYPDIEYVIVDGGSTDGSVNIIEEYSGEISKIISEPDKGIYDAMNKGIQIATGEAVCMLNSDDLYTDATSVSRLVQKMKSSGSDTIFADLVYVSRHNSNRIIRYYDSSNFHPGLLRCGWMPAHPTFLIKRALYEKWGGYRIDYQIAADFEMMVRLFYKAGVSYSYLPYVAVKMGIGGISTGGFRNSYILNKEIVRACKENGLETNLLRVLLKFPAKILELLFRHRTHRLL